MHSFPPDKLLYNPFSAGEKPLGGNIIFKMCLMSSISFPVCAMIIDGISALTT